LRTVTPSLPTKSCEPLFTMPQDPDIREGDGDSQLPTYSQLTGPRPPPFDNVPDFASGRPNQLDQWDFMRFSPSNSLDDATMEGDEPEEPELPYLLGNTPDQGPFEFRNLREFLLDPFTNHPAHGRHLILKCRATICWLHCHHKVFPLWWKCSAGCPAHDCFDCFNLVELTGDRKNYRPHCSRTGCGAPINPNVVLLNAQKEEVMTAAGENLMPSRLEEPLMWCCACYNIRGHNWGWRIRRDNGQETPVCSHCENYQSSACPDCIRCNKFLEPVRFCNGDIVRYGVLHVHQLATRSRQGEVRAPGKMIVENTPDVGDPGEDIWEIAVSAMLLLVELRRWARELRAQQHREQGQTSQEGHNTQAHRPSSSNGQEETPVVSVNAEHQPTSEQSPANNHIPSEDDEEDDDEDDNDHTTPSPPSSTVPRRASEPLPPLCPTVSFTHSPANTTTTSLRSTVPTTTHYTTHQPRSRVFMNNNTPTRRSTTSGHHSSPIITPTSRRPSRFSSPSSHRWDNNNNNNSGPERPPNYRPRSWHIPQPPPDLRRGQTIDNRPGGACPHCDRHSEQQPPAWYSPGRFVSFLRWVSGSRQTPQQTGNDDGSAMVRCPACEREREREQQEEVLDWWLARGPEGGSDEEEEERVYFERQ
jgi:hypothetical protein